MSGGGKGPSIYEQRRMAEEEARKSELRRQRELARFARGRGNALRTGLLDTNQFAQATLLGGGTKVAGP